MRIYTEEEIAKRWFRKIERAAIRIIGHPDLRGRRHVCNGLLEILNDIDIERHGYCRTCQMPCPLGVCDTCGSKVEDLRVVKHG